MYINNKLIDFLNDAQKISNSSIIVTDLDKIVFVASSSKKIHKLLNLSISNDLKQISQLFLEDISSIDYINSSMCDVVPIIYNDDVSKYKSQIILPIIHGCDVDGLLIFVADDRYFIKSNLKFAKTTRHFTELLS